MKKLFVLISAVLFVSVVCFSRGMDIYAKQRRHLPRRGAKYEYCQLELASAQRQSGFQKENMERAYTSYLLNQNESSLMAYKEAQLSYENSSFYVKYGKEWLNEKWQLEEAEFQCQVVSYPLRKSEYQYRKREVRFLKKRYEEASHRQKKGKLTRTEAEEIRCKLLSAREQFRQKKQELHQLKKEIQKRIKKQKIPDCSAPKIHRAAWYLSRWKRTKTEHRQISHQIAAFQKYKDGLDAGSSGQNRHMVYADTEIRRLTLQESQVLVQMNQTIRQKRTAFLNAKRMQKGKDREISLARKKYQLVRLLWKKGKIVKSQVLEQRADMARLESEKAALQYDMDVAAIQLEYGME